MTVTIEPTTFFTIGVNVGFRVEFVANLLALHHLDIYEPQEFRRVIDQESEI